jgi:hypothetical protein
MERIFKLIMKGLAVLFFAVSVIALPKSIMAQEEEKPLILSLTKDFGFAAAGQIQGSFTLEVRSPEDLMQVDFFIDGKLVYTDTQTPFQYNFNTADYMIGEHTFLAIGYHPNGEKITSSAITREFINAEDAWKNVGALVVPLFVVIGVLALLGTLGGALIGKQRVFSLGEYGVAGGAVCPRCELPYTRSLLALNMLVGKLQRCPHCRKWAVVPRASALDLAAAEQQYRSMGDGKVDLLEKKMNYKELLDESRYER